MRGWLAIALCLIAVDARADVSELDPPGPLRLDESPSLSLLAPYRQASGRSAAPLARWSDGPYAEWLRRSWHTLDWEAALDAGALSSSEPPINPNVSVLSSLPAPLAHALRPRAGWPFAMESHHWFSEAQGDDALQIAPELLPPWLRRLDPHWAHALLSGAACGLGGSCSAGQSFPANVFATVWQALTPAIEPPPWWECRERPLRVHRYGREQDTFVVLRCDGSIPDGALERLSMLARPPGVERVELPPERDPRSKPGEWVPGIRLLHPRLSWVLHRIALSFPWRAIYIFSGYRPSDEPLGSDSHRSKHADGRALDIMVEGIDSEELLARCHRLPDVGCGYYPHNKFVHIDVRARGSGHGVWVDQSLPGEPSRFVYSWPGVVENGRVIWQKR